ncbi:hypothetical protein C8R44DRAFT_874076 [Mycena epipterygia]|nr:hypothetical protein C8R44DRAFT_874076 [Mycena epipterygia]
MQFILLAFVLALGVAAQPTINTPTVGSAPGASECQPLLITWSGGTPPYFVPIFISVQNNPPGATPIAAFDSQSGTSVTWTVNATVGTQLILTIKDNTGAPASSAPFPVLTGSGDSCIGAGGGTSGGSTSAGSTDSGSSAGAGTTAGATSSGAAAGGGSSVTSTKPSAPSNPRDRDLLPTPPARPRQSVSPPASSLLSQPFWALPSSPSWLKEPNDARLDRTYTNKVDMV